MKKIILVLHMALMIAPPCFAQEVEPEGMFSVDGTLWRVCSIAFFPEPQIPPFVEITCGEEMGFYQGKIYWEGGYYIDLGVVSIAYAINISSYTNRYFLAIVQPTIGLGLASVILFHHWCGKFGCALPYFGYSIGFMYQINDKWSPTYLNIVPNKGRQGQYTSVNIQGVNTHFESGNVDIAFIPGDGMTISDIRIIINTDSDSGSNLPPIPAAAEIKFALYIERDAPIGFRRVEVTWGEGSRRYVSKQNDGFEVLP